MDSTLRLVVQLMLVIVPLALLAYGLNFWFSLKKQHILSVIYRRFQELPAELVPAVAGRLLNGCTVSFPELVATIFDLAQRGYIRIEKIRDKDHGFLHISSDDYRFVRLLPEDRMLSSTNSASDDRSARADGISFSSQGREKALPFEIDLMDFIFADIGDAREVRLSEIRAFSEVHSEKLSDFMKGWQQSVEMESEKHHFVDETKLKYASLSANAGYGMAGIGLAFVGFGFSAAMVPILAGLSMVACKFSVKKKCCRGSHQFQQWQEFKGFLLHLSKFRSEIPASMPIWEHYLSYAVAFGITNEVVHELNILIPAEKRTGYKGPAWYVYEGQTRGFEALKSIYIDVSGQLKNALEGR